MTALSHCDVLILGAGPAGMAAALAAAPSGATIRIVDDNPAPGGQVWRDGPAVHLPRRALRLRESLGRHSNVSVISGTRVVGVPQAGRLLLEDAQRSWRQGYGKLILCSGARELLLPFPGWTLPGVTGAGGLQALIKGGLPVCGQRIVVAGSGPLLLAVAATAQAAGAQVLRVLEQAPLAAMAAFAASLWRWPAKSLQAVGLAHAGYRTSSHVLAALGTTHLESISIRQGRQTLELACDRLACGFGLIPNTELAVAMGCSLNPRNGIAVDELQGTGLADLYAAGECTGIGGSDAALVQGAIAGHAAAGDTTQARALGPQRARWDAFARALDKRFSLDPALRGLAAPDTLVCRCEDVPFGAITAFDNWTQAKLHTRCGMGACQGRVCGAAVQHLFGWRPGAPRLPLFPARIGTLAATHRDLK
jgi:D-hydroxyproline dehydrogenase subunit alpha